MPQPTPNQKHTPGDFPKPSGPMVDFYLAANAQYKKGERIPWSLNGYTGTVTVGERNMQPMDVVKIFQDAKSRTVVPNLEKYDPFRRGVPRSQEQFLQPETTVAYQSDYDVQIFKVDGE